MCSRNKCDVKFWCFFETKSQYAQSFFFSFFSLSSWEQARERVETFSVNTLKHNASYKHMRWVLEASVNGWCVCEVSYSETGIKLSFGPWKREEEYISRTKNEGKQGADKYFWGRMTDRADAIRRLTDRRFQHKRRTERERGRRAG